VELCGHWNRGGERRKGFKAIGLGWAGPFQTFEGWLDRKTNYWQKMNQDKRQRSEHFWQWVLE
jgi:hypothetical protein